MELNRKDETFACKTFRLLKQNAVFSQRPTFIAKFQSLLRQIRECRGRFENLLEKNATTHYTIRIVVPRNNGEKLRILLQRYLPIGNRKVL